ncbi:MULTISPECIES: rRNA maturation RNAse YbeY [unclassified Desulfovibrio]|uniref:rRNA maturation RNAse YbeY n=1 Tax=unclassified Desulfovibrio TaxID=2593640 RepID=UPI000F5EAE0F|nr:MULTISPECIES: rRNA maturation RNAse YbeY [unclassified Desulfovibrio]RRD72307.1 rRNA maturation RNase YbeY [Desulfovibrio sp. OH1209_COT-279]RRD88418.1 rRNA maturation RNase YbeY [Desulfovibrio sp. OH1186_COT-070]
MRKQAPLFVVSHQRVGVVPVVRIFCCYAAAAWLLPLDRRALRICVAAMTKAAHLAAPPFSPRSVDIWLLDDAHMGVANARHMACCGPTNVLSFPAGSDGAGALLFGVDSMRRECLLYGQEPVEHTLRLLAHGMAHVVGFDHGFGMDELCEKLVAAARTACHVHYRSVSGAARARQ